MPQNTPDCDVYILTGFISIEKQIEKKALIFFNNICNQHEESIEKRLARRQLSTKKQNSNSWFMNLKILLLKYNQDDPLDLLDNPRKKEEWKLNVIKQINQSWKEHILHSVKLYKNLQHIATDKYRPGKIHPLLSISCNSSRDVNRIPTKLRTKLELTYFRPTEHLLKMEKIVVYVYYVEVMMKQ